ncbi:MAG: hypothetical protein AVDCRST_MAG56-3580 [uncultured Cytophagales bacterium]|uniref:Uncharacterized protein n=1 Tax=uncultured Cytophagales bacterium TaxID=158755 RepID=A0A6J4JDV4_9SPHI|nr:MAG: hypothetical protein AVDCRST_MAG56-3580 [uncultured Cytophagales bacterium]
MLPVRQSPARGQRYAFPTFLRPGGFPSGTPAGRNFTGPAPEFPRGTYFPKTIRRFAAYVSAPTRR